MQFPLLVTAAFFCFTASISTQQEYAEQLSAAIQEGDEPSKTCLARFLLQLYDCFKSLDPFTANAVAVRYGKRSVTF